MYKNKQAEPRSRYHFAESYLTREQIEQVLHHYEDYIVGALYILHDKDVKETDETAGRRRDELNKLKEKTKTEIDYLHKIICENESIYKTKKFDSDDIRKKWVRDNITIIKSRLTRLQNKIVNADNEILEINQQESQVGDLKTAHWHILIKTYDQHTANAVRKWFYRFRITEEKEVNGVKTTKLVNTLNKIVDSVSSSRDYLTHRNDPDKYQYSDAEIIEFRAGRSVFKMHGRTADEVIDIIDRLNAGESKRTLIREYGRDFAYHFKTYLYLADYIAREECDAYNEFEEAEKVMLSGNQKAIAKLDFVKLNQYAMIIEAFQEFSKQVNTLTYMSQYQGNKFNE